MALDAILDAGKLKGGIGSSIVDVTTDLHLGEGSSYGETLTRRLCDEMAEKIAKLFYEHMESKQL